jgi:hypothetical protein
MLSQGGLLVGGGCSVLESGGPDSAAPRAVILLAGQVRSTDLSRAAGRSLLDLPIEDDRTVLRLWLSHVRDLAEAWGAPDLPVRILIDRSSQEPTIGPPRDLPRVVVERDAAEFRGTGGLLRDVAMGFAPSDWLLVATAAQIPIAPLTSITPALMANGASVSLIAHSDGTPGGLCLVRCAVLREAAGIGFLDFKEQLLPRLAAAGHDIRVIQHRTAVALPVRTLDGYIAGLRTYHRVRAGGSARPDALAEDWSPTFAIVEHGALVDTSATIHDSVVLRGARVQRGAVVVRSVIGPGGVVRSGQTIADQVIGTPASRQGRPA